MQLQAANPTMRKVGNGAPPASAAPGRARRAKPATKPAVPKAAASKAAAAKAAAPVASAKPHRTPCSPQVTDHSSKAEPVRTAVAVTAEADFYWKDVPAVHAVLVSNPSELFLFQNLALHAVTS